MPEVKLRTLLWTGIFPGTAPISTISEIQDPIIQAWNGLYNEIFCGLKCKNMMKSVMGMWASIMFMCKLSYYGAHPYNQSASRITNTQN